MATRWLTAGRWKDVKLLHYLNLVHVRRTFPASAVLELTPNVKKFKLYDGIPAKKMVKLGCSCSHTSAPPRMRRSSLTLDIL